MSVAGTRSSGRAWRSRDETFLQTEVSLSANGGLGVSGSEDLFDIPGIRPACQHRSKRKPVKGRAGGQGRNGGAMMGQPVGHVPSGSRAVCGQALGGLAGTPGRQVSEAGVMVQQVTGQNAWDKRIRARGRFVGRSGVTQSVLLLPRMCISTPRGALAGQRAKFGI